MKTLLQTFITVSLASLATANETSDSINRFGLALHHRLAAKGGNVVFSPYSIEAALAMAYAGADGKTKDEMAKVLHFGADEKALHDGFATLSTDLRKCVDASTDRLAREKKKAEEYAKKYRIESGYNPASPLEINVANRIFGQEGQVIEKPFLTLLEETYHAPLEILSFKKDAEAARKKINTWVEQKTKNCIKDLIRLSGVDANTRLVLCNAVYFKAPWATNPFHEMPLKFAVNGKQKSEFPGLVREDTFGYTKVPGGAAVIVPYVDGGLQFILFVPENVDGLADMEKQLTPQVLASVAKATRQDILLRFPKFKLKPDTVDLTAHLAAMGMPTAFDQPKGSADYSRMAPRKPTDYLGLSSLFHKAFIAVDEKGTEAAVATAESGRGFGGAPPPKPKPLEVTVDRPFAFAIQHVESGACLFLGRVTDPH